MSNLALITVSQGKDSIKLMKKYIYFRVIFTSLGRFLFNHGIFRVISLALSQLYDSPSASEETLNDVDKFIGYL